MDAGRHNLTRRALIGAVFVAPAVLGDCADQAGAATPDLVIARRWDRALAALERARTAEQAFRDGPMAAAERAFRAIRERWPFTYDFEVDPEARATVRAAFAAYDPWANLEAAHQHAVQHLLLVPVPDLSALAMKIGLAVDHEIWECEGGDHCMVALGADALNLVNGSDYVLSDCGPRLASLENFKLPDR